MKNKNGMTVLIASIAIMLGVVGCGKKENQQTTVPSTSVAKDSNLPVAAKDSSLPVYSSKREVIPPEEYQDFFKGLFINDPDGAKRQGYICYSAQEPGIRRWMDFNPSYNIDKGMNLMEFFKDADPSNSLSKPITHSGNWSLKNGLLETKLVKETKTTTGLYSQTYHNKINLSINWEILKLTPNSLVMAAKLEGGTVYRQCNLVGAQYSYSFVNDGYMEKKSEQIVWPAIPK
ncbi:MAG: hypothetical protein KKD65_12795 [Gammaproteobacteria bacterium]|nr:hypothetical protein [Gammaproteobacteria bacterium]